MNECVNYPKMLSLLRGKEGISQEVLAEKIGVSKQAIQKWETGKCMPDLENMLKLAKYWNVSLDFLMFGVDRRSVEEMRTAAVPLPSYEKQHTWEAYYKTLPTEYQECLDEGKDAEAYKELINAVSRLQDQKLKADLADRLYPVLDNLPIKNDYPYSEPSDYDGILRERAPVHYTYPHQSRERTADKIKGAWYGRICGCLLGKPIEGIKSSELILFLKASGNYPLCRYLVRSDVGKAGDQHFTFPFENRLYEDGVMAGMPCDDDTNYIILALLTVKKYGKDFEPEDVAHNWLDMQPKNAYCTAERVAFRNFVNGYLPPESAKYQNPYREWIGAQIRGDFFGWINPGNPEAAAKQAFRDACISHVKNGIYGEMWVSAMLAAACGGADIPSSLRIGMSYIPEKSRLFEALNNVIAAHADGMTSEKFFDDLHRRWDENNGHHWCHTISNAEIVAASLLWGGGDYEKSICLAVQQGFDTDCNGATVGSVIGAANGFSALPDKWTSKISGTLFTSIFGYEKVSVDEMADETLRMAE